MRAATAGGWRLRGGGRWSQWGLLAGVVCLGLASGAWACMAIGRQGQGVSIEDETAIIVWDEQHQTEHFLRRASFQTNAGQFAFLVPTPTVPKFTEVDNTIFNQLQSLTAPRIQRREVRRGWSCQRQETTRMSPAAKMTDNVAVQVHSRVQLTGQEAVVLSADQAEEIIAWLKEHDFPADDRFIDWLQPYVKRGWKITAFRYTGPQEDTPAKSPTAGLPEGPEAAAALAHTVGDHPEAGMGSGSGFPQATRPAGSLNMPAVCLSFQTTKPFYPYREPAAQPDQPQKFPPRKPRSLRVFFFSTERVDGYLEQTRQFWAGIPVWSKRLDVPILGGLHALRSIPGLDLFEVPRLTEFDDLSRSRPDGLDVEFERAQTQNEIERPPQVVEVLVGARGLSSDALWASLLGLVMLRRVWRKPAQR